MIPLDMRDIMPTTWPWRWVMRGLRAGERRGRVSPTALLHQIRLGPLQEHHHPPVGLLAFALGREAGALDELVLEAAEVVVLGGELDGPAELQNLAHRLLHLAHDGVVQVRMIVDAEGG